MLGVMRSQAIKGEEDPDPVVQGEEAKRAVAIEVQPMMIQIAHVPKNARDQKAGEREENVDAVASPQLHFIDETQEMGTRVG